MHAVAFEIQSCQLLSQSRKLRCAICGELTMSSTPHCYPIYNVYMRMWEFERCFGKHHVQTPNMLTIWITGQKLLNQVPTKTDLVTCLLLLWSLRFYWIADPNIWNRGPVLYSGAGFSRGLFAVYFVRLLPMPRCESGHSEVAHGDSDRNTVMVKSMTLTNINLNIKTKSQNCNSLLIKQ